ncbi:ADP-ribosylglycohydrolase family protein [Desulfosarcina sp.]|uniref:ADP-ribosylglycohydrolase family protein n=1 Tax=Desulfosarcina sp. TaxID=2027861 RepID=UPI0029A84960|nr:ADP-ribosylglycohydrolase family protein [Desulfosarcina sp.]MDX2454911.1 ADP-ribosylglycohydrolase family protein [Desulfosarcina sp.]MDX2492493.1 ADP-ribosylglycohydrolase family protein [Desulfosarcina sp.]
MTDNRIKAAVIGAFVADALSLGVHWVYNTDVIDKKLGRVEHYYDPMTSYHTGKKAGDFTHYGDQMMVLLESMSGSGFDANRFADMWRTFFADYGGYFDKATKTTLKNMDAGKDLTESASDSDDLAGASRLAALVSVYHGNLEQLVGAARAQTRITHNNDRGLSSADFFARTVFAVLGGQPPQAALQATLDTHFSDSSIASLITMGLESRDRDTRETIAEFGQMCSVEAGLPGAVHLISRYADDFKTAMVENVMAGGDSSARGMIAGMVLGAAHGMVAIPEAWQTGMTASQRISALLDQL